MPPKEKDAAAKRLVALMTTGTFKRKFWMTEQSGGRRKK
jgi:hypothetical protein